MGLNEMLEKRGEPGLIDPVELRPEDVPGKLFIPICLLGLFNPMGPTVAALSMVVAEDKPSGALLCTRLNPFNQTRELIARTGASPAELKEVLPTAYRCGDELLLNGVPDLILLGDGIADCVAELNQLLFGLVNSAVLEKPLSEINRDYLENMGNPWERIPSMEEMMRRAFSEQEPEAYRGGISKADFDDWLQIMMSADHAVPEFRAIMQAWEGAIGQVPGMAHMPLSEAAKELTVLGFPFFKFAA